MAKPLIDEHGNNLTEVVDEFRDMMLQQLSRHLHLDPDTKPDHGWRGLLLTSIGKLVRELDVDLQDDVAIQKQAADVANVVMLLAWYYRR